MENTTMKSKIENMASSKVLIIAGVITLTGLVAPSLVAAAEKKEATTAKKDDVTTGPSSGKKEFDKPKQAVDALVQVASNFDPNAAKELLGPDAEDIVSSGDPVADKNQAE